MATLVQHWWWFFALRPDSRLTPLENAGVLLLCALLALIFGVFLPWSYQGGPAWGRYWMGRPRGMSYNNAIPGPRGWPVVGSMRLMSGLAHRKLAVAAASLHATRLMAFSVGTTRAFVTCNPDVAREILQGSAFADRPVKESAYALMFDRAIGFAPYGAYWRSLRRVAATHMFCPRQIAASEHRRIEIAARMSARFAISGPGVQVRDVLRIASLDHMMGCIFGKDYGLDETNTEVVELTELVQEGYDILGVLNLSDHLPFLGLLDLQRIRRRCSRLIPRVKRFVGKIIDEHRSVSISDEKKTNFLDVLLSFRGSFSFLSDSDLIAVLWEMIFRGTDTVVVLIEWVLARMVMHPEVQGKVQQQLDDVVGRARPVADSDLAGLTYVKAVVKETLRLHPPGPLLSWARLATEDAVVDGWQVPAGTTAMVNMWAIGRDPSIWPDPLEFSPERFLQSGPDPEFSVLGSDLRLAPFGSGRRSCPGKTLGLATIYLWVASLLHEFVWMPGGPAPVDLSERLRLSCEMASPLNVNVLRRRP
ncbi:Cytochrome P450 78A3 [Nymphaea thermarum]|nr:Cytochrome P450 78A3 [Nymphaea thermarum]